MNASRVFLLVSVLSEVDPTHVICDNRGSTVDLSNYNSKL